MRVKEFRNVLDNMPDDAEVLIRAQVYKNVQTNPNECCMVTSVTPILNDEQRQLVLNPEAKLRFLDWRPEKKENVVCTDCKNYAKLLSCRKKKRDCKECSMPCTCKRCEPYNCENPLPFEERPMFLKKAEE